MTEMCFDSKRICNTFAAGYHLTCDAGASYQGRTSLDPEERGGNCFCVSGTVMMRWTPATVGWTAVYICHIRGHIISHFFPQWLVALVHASIVDRVLVEQMRKDICFLTSKDGTSGIVLRHSLHWGARIAARRIKQQFEETGATSRLVPFLAEFVPNVIQLQLSVKGLSHTGNSNILKV